MKPSILRLMIVGLVTGILAVPTTASVQQASAPSVKKAAAPYKYPTEGKAMYISYCGACHGAQGRGDGPAAPAMKVVPTNLTMLMKNNGGKFPEVRFREILTTGTVVAHGNAEMPIWGPVFNGMDQDPAITRVRVETLMRYVEVLNYPIK